MKKNNLALAEALDTNALIDSVSGLVGIEVPDQHREMVAMHLQIAAKMADLVHSVELDSRFFELAPVFTPQELTEGEILDS